MQGAYRLPESLRPTLSRPLGRFFSVPRVNGRSFARTVSDAAIVVTVGDKVTETVYSLGRTPDVQVVDGMERRMRRKPPEVPYARLIKVRNPAGFLTRDSLLAVDAAFRGEKPVRILVEGEEDLVAIPTIALAPVTAVVFYGQPGEGIVAVKADAGAKSRSRAILAQMGITELANSGVD